MTIVDRYAALAPKFLGITRFLVGVLFAAHGAQKVFGAFGGLPPGVPWWISHLGGTIELVGGVLLAIGLFTRPVAFLCSGTMAVGYFYGHARQGFWPNVNGGELAVVYCWFFLYLSAAGPGAFAVDTLLWRRKG